MLSKEKKIKEDRNKDYSNGISVPEGRRGGSSSHGKFDRRCVRYERGTHGLRPSHFEEDDGHRMRDVREDPRASNPYARSCNKRRQKWSDAHQFLVTVRRDPQSQESALAEDTQERSAQSWFKITIPCGREYDKVWLVNLIQSHCGVSFSPVDFHYINSRAFFFVQDASVASKIKDVRNQIYDERRHRIAIFVQPSIVPYSVQNKFTPEQMEHLKANMCKRYDVSQQALNLQQLRYDPELTQHKIEMILNRRNCMFVTLQIIESNFPEVVIIPALTLPSEKLLSLNLQCNKLYKLDGLADIVGKAPHLKILNLSKNELNSIWELEKVKGLKLEELWIKGNPFCSKFPDKSDCVSAIRDCFPKLLRLDGQELSPPVVTEVDTPRLMKSCKESCKVSEASKNLVLRFLKDYYLIYDYGDRQGLLSTYHDEACFSLATSLDPGHLDMSNWRAYFQCSRNMEKLKDPYLQRQLLKHKKRDIADFFMVLPKTQHDSDNFVVDIWLERETMLCFSVSGVFKEIQGMSQGCVRAFTRTFVAVPGSTFCLCIVNDQLFVRDARPDEIQGAFSGPSAAPCYGSVPTLSQERQRMVEAFSLQSGMKLEWSQKCLEDNGWNYTGAGQIFVMFQTQGKIPTEAFKQSF